MSIQSVDNRLADLEARYNVQAPSTVPARLAGLENLLGIAVPTVQSTDNRLAQLESAANRRIIPQLNGTIAINPNSGTDSNNTFRLTYATGPSACTDLQVVLAGWMLGIPNGAEIPIGATVLYKLAIEFGGAFFPIVFPGGGRVATVPSGNNTVVSLPLKLAIPANTGFFVRVQASIPGPGVLPETEVIWTHTFSAGDLVDALGALGSTTSGQPGPVMILGTLTGVTKPTVAIVGDSIAEGYLTTRLYYPAHNGTGDTVANRGFIRAALGTNFSNINVASPGESATQFSPVGAPGRLNLLAMAQCEYAISNYGTNDLYGTLALTDVQTEAALVTVWKQLAQRVSKGIFQTTITPRTSSTDAWATTTNQTILSPAINTLRVNVNTWLRAGAPLDPNTLTAVPIGTSGAITCNVYDKTGALAQAASGVGHYLKGVFETADLAESARNSGLWAVGPLTTDGIHPTALGVTTLAPSIVTSLLV